MRNGYTKYDKLKDFDISQYFTEAHREPDPQPPLECPECGDWELSIEDFTDWEIWSWPSVGVLA